MPGKDDKKNLALIICGFPGVGKSAVESLASEIGIYRYNDMESTPYHFIFGLNGKKTRNPHFPGCYVDDIEKHAGSNGYSGYDDVIMISSHKEVRTELKNRGIPYIIVVPEKSLKDEYLLRYVARGSDISLIETVYDYWDEWLDDIEADGAPVIHLKSGQYLADVIVPEIIRENLIKGKKENKEINFDDVFGIEQEN